MVKTSYKNALCKREIQNFIFSRVEGTTIIGLPGPDVEDYLAILEEHGFQDAMLYEKDPAIFLQQTLTGKGPTLGTAVKTHNDVLVIKHYGWTMNETEMRVFLAPQQG